MELIKDEGPEEFNSIILTDKGDMLVESIEGVDNFLIGKDIIGYEAGFHDICGGVMNFFNINWANSALVCRNCYLRIIVPIEVRTYDNLRGELRHFQ